MRRRSGVAAIVAVGVWAWALGGMAVAHDTEVENPASTESTIPPEGDSLRAEPGAVAAFYTLPTASERRCHNTTPRVQLSFDDGGSPAQVTRILDILEQRNVRAMMFPTGGWARANPSLVQRMVDDGHRMANHTGNHGNLAVLSEGGVRSEIASGVQGDLLRPPGGNFTQRTRDIAASMGYRICMWDIDPFDWKGISASAIHSRVLPAVSPGVMILLHLQGRSTGEALPGLIDGIRARGYELEALSRVVDADYDPTTGSGIWLDTDGTVETSSASAHRGDLPSIGVDGAPLAGIAVHPRGGGYWLVADDGGVFTFGTAAFHGSMGATPLVEPIVGMAPTPSGKGYWLVASDGGVFTFGDAAFHGSTGGIRLDRPIVGIEPTPSGRGYWLVASDGGVFTFGDAAYHGSAGGVQLDQQIVDIAATQDGSGYWLLGKDGGVFTYGSAPFRGAYPRSAGPVEPFLSLRAEGGGYRMLTEEVGHMFVY